MIFFNYFGENKQKVCLAIVSDTSGLRSKLKCSTPNQRHHCIHNIFQNKTKKMFFNSLSICSNVQNASSFHQMARMMDSLILNEFPPYAFTKITTTHRPVRTSNGMTTTKLLAKSTANIASSTAGNNNNNNNINGSANYHHNNNGTSSVASVLGMNGGLRQTPLQKSKVPMQGLQLYSKITYIPISIPFSYHKRRIQCKLIWLKSKSLQNVSVKLNPCSNSLKSK